RPMPHAIGTATRASTSVRSGTSRSSPASASRRLRCLDPPARAPGILAAPETLLERDDAGGELGVGRLRRQAATHHAHDRLVPDLLGLGGGHVRDVGRHRETLEEPQPVAEVPALRLAKLAHPYEVVDGRAGEGEEAPVVDVPENAL